VYEWKIRGDLKVIAILLKVQKGYTKYCCFLCERGSRAKDTTTRREVGLNENHQQLEFKM
jgi:hypothetical protein